MILPVNYKPPFPFIGQHVETIVPALVRKVNFAEEESSLLDTPDGDFLELDWYRQNSKKLVIISHGLEGSSKKAYTRGMAKIFFKNGFDALCWNYRGCGERINNKPILYHSGATYDLDTVVQHGVTSGYQQLVLVGFSLGGNITLKYVGEQGETLNPAVKFAIAISVPVDLAAGCRQISKLSNWMYAYRFLRHLKAKIRLKNAQFPEIFKLNGISKINNLYAFDNTYTGPIHGFKDADDYYAKCSAINFLSGISIPTCIINALNDPFLPDECYPFDEIARYPKIKFITPNHGGHVGFMASNNNGFYWSESEAINFVLDNLQE